jgi:hypothetical protein
VSDTQDPKLEKKRRLALALRQNLGKRKIHNQDKNTPTAQNQRPFSKDDALVSVVKVIT